MVLVLSNLKEYYKRRIKLQRSFISAITYPALVVCTALLAIIFMLNFIVPMFEDVFKRFQGELPALTRVVIAISNLISDNIGLMGFILLIVVTCALFLKRKRWYRLFISSLLLRVPVVGKIIKRIYIARFCQSMSMLINSKTPMLTALQLVKRMIFFIPFQIVIERIENDILHGSSLHASMEKYGFFDRRIIALTKVGEEVNELGSLFKELGEQYSEEVEHQTEMLNNLLEPLMILFVGGIVALILVSMYLPLFQLSSSFIG